MATGIFTLRNQLQGLIQKAWTTPQPTYYGSFNGSTQYLSTPSIALGSGNWTIEFFLYLNTVSTAFYFDGRGGGSNGFQPTIYYNGSIYFYTNGGIVITGPSLNSGQWYHVAVSKVSGSTRLFLNGVQQGSTYSDSNTYVASSTNIQYIGGGLFFTNGLISNLRITNTGLYSANFAPPTLQLTAVSGTQLLTLQNSTIIDNSTNAYTITNNGSVATAQSNLVFPNAQKTPAVDYLVVAGGGGGDYAGGGGAGGLIQGISSITTGSSITVTVGSGGAGDVAANGAAAQGGVSVFNNISTTGGGAGINNGTALASKNSGGSGGGGGINASLNSAGQGTFGQGNIGGTSTSTNAGGGGGAGTVGLNATTYSGNGGAGIASAISGTVTTYAGGGGGGAASSYNSNVGSGGVGGGGSGSITNGTSGTANTGGGGGGSGYNGSSYGNGGSGGSGIVIISYPDTYNAPTTLTGTYTASTSGSGSFAPLNTSSWIYYNAPSNLQFGTGDFTIEMWVYLTSTSGTNYLVDFRGTNAPTGSSFGIYQNSGGLQTFSTNLNVNYGVPAANTWYNVVWSRTSGVSYFFVNGTLVNAGGTTDTTSYTAGTNGPSFGGSTYYAVNNFGLQGYMSNLRVLKGTGLYTSNFTPSTKPLTAITNTSLLLSTVSGAYLADGSTNANTASVTGTVSWNQASPFATGLGYKNRVYTWTGSGTVTF